MEKEESVEAMWKQIFQIQKYDLESWRKILTVLKTRVFSFQFLEFFKNTSGGCFFKISNFVSKMPLVGGSEIFSKKK